MQHQYYKNYSVVSIPGLLRCFSSGVGAIMLQVITQWSLTWKCEKLGECR